MGVHHNTVTVRCSPKLGGDCEVGYTYLKKYPQNFDDTFDETTEREDNEAESAMAEGQDRLTTPQVVSLPSPFGQVPQFAAGPERDPSHASPVQEGLATRAGGEARAPPSTSPQVPRDQVQPRHTSVADLAREEFSLAEHRQRGYYMVESILNHRYRQGYQFLTKWETFSVQESTWEPLKNFIQEDGCINSVLKDYCASHQLDRAFKQALNLASRATFQQA